MRVYDGHVAGWYSLEKLFPGGGIEGQTVKGLPDAVGKDFQDFTPSITVPSSRRRSLLVRGRWRLSAKVSSSGSNFLPGDIKPEIPVAKRIFLLGSNSAFEI